MTGRIHNPAAYYKVVNANAAPLSARERAQAEHYAEDTRRVAEIRNQLIEDGYDWQTANDEAVERVIIARDHQHADDAADAQQEQTR